MTSNNNLNDEDFDRLYQIFKKNVDVPTVLSATEMDHFAPLFDRKLRQAHDNLDPTFSASLENNLQQLSNEFLHSVDPYKPIYIVPDNVKEQLEAGDITQEDAEKQNIYVLPPLYTKLYQSKANRELVDAFNNICSHDDKNANSPTNIRMKEIRKAIGDTVASAQSQEQILEGVNQFMELTERFNQKMLNAGTRKPVELPAPTENTNQSDNIDDFLDFD